MKKLLTMALALIMILSLCAVPSMAVTMTDYLINEDFDDVAVGALPTSTSETSFSVGSNSSGAIVSIASEGIAANGNSVNVLKLNNTTVNKTPALYSNTFDVLADTAYFLTFDYYVVEPSLTTQNASYAVRMGNNTTYAAQTAAGDGKAFYSDNGTSWKSGTWKYYVPEKEEDDTAYVTGQWATKTVYIKSDCARTNEYIIWQMWNGFTNQEAAGTICYFDNISLSAEVEAAAVTKTVNGNGTMTGITDDVVPLNSAHTLTLTPASTSYLSSLTVNGVDVTEGVTQTWNADLGNYVGTYDVTVAADTTIVAAYADYTLVKKVNSDMEDIDELTTTSTTEIWSKASTAVAAIESDATNGQYIEITSGTVRTPKHTMDLGLYKFSLDAKATAAANLQLQHGSATSAATGNGKYNGTEAGAAYVAVTTDWAHYDMMFELTDYANVDANAATEYTLSFKAMSSGVTYCIDNVKIEYYSKAAAPVTPTTATVTISGENAVTSVDAATVTIGESTRFTAKPKFGYYIQSITIGGNTFNGFDAYKGGTYGTGEINADTAIVVTTAALSANTDEDVATEVATLPSVFAPAADTAVTFGKVLDTTDATSWGIELTQNGVGVTPYHGGSYLYKANATNANGQYAIEFVGLEAGTYQIRSYIYVDGTAVFGAPATFVVD